MEEWKEYKLGDVVISVKDRITTSALNASSYISTENMLPNKAGITLSSGVPSGNAIKFVADDILISNIRPYFKKIWQADRIGGCSSDVICLRATNITEPNYLYYLLSQDRFFDYVMQGTKGTKMPRGDRSQIMQWPVLLPSKNTQKDIASILKSLDDKIEINRRINENLEQQAQALFKSWFVDFEPFKDGEFVESELGMIPKGWRIGTLGEILNLRRNSYKKGSDLSLPYMPIDVIPMHSLGVNEFKDNKEAQSSLQIFEKNDIIIGAMRVYFHRVVIAPCKGITRNTCFVLKPKSENLFAYSILQCNQDDAIDFANRTSKGSTMPYAVWDNGLADYGIVIPPNSILERFNTSVSPILEKIRDSYKESRRLAELRDTLLPRLMSGELKVDEINL